MAQKGEALTFAAQTIRGSAAVLHGRSNMKLHALKAAYALALLVAFVVAAGAGSKFHGLGN